MTDDSHDFASCEDFLAWAEDRNPGETEFHQALGEIAHSVWPLLDDRPAYRDSRILERLSEPERIVRFRVVWEDDDGKVRINRGWRVQFSSAIGPYKGGLRFSPDATTSVFKFLALEQTLKNALTGLPLGSAKGGADFDPHGRSDGEIMRFCQAFMTELCRHIGPATDIAAGDIGVGPREIGYLFGQYKRIRNRFDGALTGKGLAFGGAPLRAEATGYGLVHFACIMAHAADRSLDGQRIAISGAGNVALHAAERATAYGAKVVSLSDSGGALICEDGFDAETIDRLKTLKLDEHGALADADGTTGLRWDADGSPWQGEFAIALPCATQNEVDADTAGQIVEAGAFLLAEGANMPCTHDAVVRLKEGGLLYAPGKAANAGGVAVSGFEMRQNSAFARSDREALDDRLKDVMAHIHDMCLDHAGKNGDYATGANRAGFRKVADAMLAQGLV